MCTNCVSDLLKVETCRNSEHKGAAIAVVTISHHKIITTSMIGITIIVTILILMITVIVIINIINIIGGLIIAITTVINIISGAQFAHNAAPPMMGGGTRLGPNDAEPPAFYWGEPEGPTVPIINNNN